MLTGLPGPAYRVPPPRCIGGRVLYLDYDGVLHPESVYVYPKLGPVLLNAPGHRLFEHCALLEEVLVPYPDVCVVLSTSWMRRYKSLSHVVRRLTPTLRVRVVGATYHSRMDQTAFASAPRGMQIWSDVLRRMPMGWLALDDDYVHWPAWCREQLVRTDEVLGISAPPVLKEKLATMHKEM